MFRETEYSIKMMPCHLCIVICYRAVWQQYMFWWKYGLFTITATIHKINFYTLCNNGVQIEIRIDLNSKKVRKNWKKNRTFFLLKRNLRVWRSNKGDRVSQIKEKRSLYETNRRLWQFYPLRRVFTDFLDSNHLWIFWEATFLL